MIWTPRGALLSLQRNIGSGKIHDTRFVRRRRSDRHTRQLTTTTAAFSHTHTTVTIYASLLSYLPAIDPKNMPAVKRFTSARNFACSSQTILANSFQHHLQRRSPDGIFRKNKRMWERRRWFDNKLHADSTIIFIHSMPPMQHRPPSVFGIQPALNSNCTSHKSVKLFKPLNSGRLLMDADNLSWRNCCERVFTQYGKRS